VGLYLERQIADDVIHQDVVTAVELIHMARTNPDVFGDIDGNLLADELLGACSDGELLADDLEAAFRWGRDINQHLVVVVI